MGVFLDGAALRREAALRKSKQRCAVVRKIQAVLRSAAAGLLQRCAALLKFFAALRSAAWASSAACSVQKHTQWCFAKILKSSFFGNEKNAVSKIFFCKH